MVASKRKKVVNILVPKIIGDVKTVYCRVCMRNRPASSFYTAVDNLLDKNGYMSVCKDCLDTLYEKFFQIDKSVSKAILRLCRAVNLYYDATAVEMSEKHLQTMEVNGRAPGRIVGIYRSKLVKVENVSGNVDSAENLTFVEPVQYFVKDNVEDFEKGVDITHLKNFWGDNLDYSDYIVLEREYANFKESHKADTYTEKVLLKLVCFKLLEIDKNRKVGLPTATLEKNLQELMKSLAISPDKVKIADSGKSLDTFGVWIKDIEEYEPCEWHDENRNKYIDLDNFKKYAEDFIVRPISNFFGMSKNFNIAPEDGSQWDDLSNDASDVE